LNRSQEISPTTFHEEFPMAKEQGRPFVSLVMGLILVAGGVAIIINAGEHTIGVIGGGVTIVVGLLFFVRSATSRRTTAAGRRRFFIS
jgi:uncharacterized membrane protein YkgB